MGVCENKMFSKTGLVKNGAPGQLEGHSKGTEPFGTRQVGKEEGAFPLEMGKQAEETDGWALKQAFEPAPEN